MRLHRILPALLAAVLLVSACSGSVSDEAASSDMAEVDFDTGAPGSGSTQADDAGEAADSGDDGDAGGVTGSLADVDVPNADLDTTLSADRKIAYRGEVDAVVDDVAAAVGSARTAVEAEGGFLFGQESTGDWARVTFKVPSVRFEAAFDGVAGIGEVGSRFVEADDVTASYTDLDSRRQTLATSIGRLRGFLEAATSVDEISRLESELTRREAEHDVIAGQLRVLDARVSLATITATFAVDDAAAQAAMVDEESGPPGFGSGLSAGWDAVTVAADAVATAAGFALPFLPLLALAALGTVWARRRRDVTATVAEAA